MENIALPCRIFFRLLFPGLTVLSTLALSACDSGPDYFKELSITYEIDGEARSPSWVFGCTRRLTGAGGYIGATSSAFGERLPSGEAVLFMMKAPTCYGDWRTPFGPQLPSEPDARFREIRPVVVWMDDAEEPARMESSLFFAHVESPKARIRLLDVTLQRVEARRADNPAPGIPWVFEYPKDLNDEKFFYDVAAVVPRESWEASARAADILATPAGEALPKAVAAFAPLVLDLNWRAFNNAGEMIPAVQARDPEVVRDADRWVRDFHYEGQTLVIDANSDDSDVVFRAVPASEDKIVNYIVYQDKTYRLGSNAIAPASMTATRYAAVRVPYSDELIIVSRVLMSKRTFSVRFGGG